jgi:hypothetical protein
MPRVSLTTCKQSITFSLLLYRKKTIFGKHLGHAKTTSSNQNQYILLLSRLKCKKNVRSKMIRGKIFINIWITKVKLFWKKSGAGVLTLQCNSYLSHVRSFFKIPSNFLSLISSYPLLKMLFSTLSFLWTTAVGPRQNM